MRFAYRLFVLAILAILMAAFVSQPVAAATGTLDQQQTSIVGGLLLYYESGSTFQFLSQTFTAGLTGLLTEVHLAVGWEGDPPNPNGDVTVEIHSGSPDGTLRGSSSLGPSYIPHFSGQAPYDFIAFTFSGVSVVAGSVYAIVITASNAQYDPPHYVVADWFLSDSYAAGTAYSRSNGGWFTIGANFDIAFKTYVAEPCYDIEQKGIPVNALDIPVGSTFTVNVWIRNIPGSGLDSFYFVVGWDQNMMMLESHQNSSNPGWDDWGPEVIGIDVIDFYGIVFGGPYITDDMIYLTLTFRCLSQGSSQITLGDGYLSIDGLENNIIPPDFVLTCNQLSRTPSNPYYVGGEVFSANKLTVLSQYLALISVVAVAAVVVKRKLT